MIFAIQSTIDDHSIYHAEPDTGPPSSRAVCSHLLAKTTALVVDGIRLTRTMITTRLPRIRPTTAQTQSQTRKSGAMIAYGVHQQGRLFKLERDNTDWTVYEADGTGLTWTPVSDGHKRLRHAQADINRIVGKVGR